MKAERVRELLPDFVRGRLGPADHTAVKAAVDADPALAGECKELDDYFKSISLPSPLKAPPGFAAAVADRIEARHRKKSLGEILFRPFSIKLTLEVTGLLATAVLIVVIYHPFPSFVGKNNPATPTAVEEVAMAKAPPPAVQPAGELSNPSSAENRSEKAVEPQMSQLRRRAASPAPRAPSASKAMAFAPAEEAKARTPAEPAAPQQADELSAAAPVASTSVASAPAPLAKADYASKAKAARNEADVQQFAQAASEEEKSSFSAGGAGAAAKVRPLESIADKSSPSQETVQLALSFEPQKSPSRSADKKYERQRSGNAAFESSESMAPPPRQTIESIVRALRGRMIRINLNTPAAGETSYSFEIPPNAYDSLASRLAALGTLSVVAEKPAGAPQSNLRVELKVRNTP